MNRYLISEHQQGTDGWRLARAGKATGSRADCILAKLKGGGEASTRRNYRVQLVVERLTGAPAENGYQSKEMQWGTEQEPFARMAYEMTTGKVVREAGFLYLPDIAAGCSVDGFVDDDDGLGINEFKCPLSATHATYLLESRLPPDYVPQVTHNVWISGADFCDFTSFDPRMPEALQLFTVRVLRGELPIQTHEAEVLRFLAEVETLEKQLRAKAVKPLALAA